MNPSELDRHLQELFDGRLEGQAFENLQQELRDDPAARAAYREHLHLQHALEFRTKGVDLLDVVPMDLVVERRQRRAIRTVGMAAAAVGALAAALLILLVGSFLSPPVKPETDVVTRPDSSAPASATSPAAILVAEAKAEFDPSYAPDGVRCEPGRYVLRSGSVHLRLLNGVDLAVKGPANFVIHDSFELDLEQGICRAAVPKAGHGFTINTAEMEVIDLGTEFGISVDPKGRTSEVRVFDGEVDVVVANSTKKTRLAMDDTLRISSSEGVTAARIRAEDFPTTRSIGFTQWQQWHDTIKQNPDIIAYLPMQKPGKPLEVISALPEAPEARLKGVRRVSGRWPGKRAILFDRDGDLVELDLGTNHEEVTIAMWIKADRWDYNTTALVTSSGWGPGALHFQASNGVDWKAHGSIRHGDRKSSRRSYSRDSVELGRWHHVAYVLSMRTGKSQVFLDGEPGPLVDIPENTQINPGVMRIGDWEWQSSLGGGHPKHKGFRGRIDEFIALSRALSQDEIGEMVTRGRPNFLWQE